MTMAFIEHASMESVTDLMQVAWVEITMFACAAFVYLVFSGGLGRFKGSKNQKAGKSVKGPSVVAQTSELQTLQQTLRRGSVNDAVAFLEPYGGDGGGKLLDSAVTEAAHRKDFDMCRRLFQLSRVLSCTMTPKSMEAFAKAHYSDAGILRVLVAEAEAPVSKPFAKAVLQACMALKDTDLVFDVFEKADAADAAELRQFVEKKSSCSNTVEAKKISDVSCTINDCRKQVRSLGKEGDLEGAVAAFEKELQKGGPVRSITFLFNSVIDACVECNDLGRARSFLERAKARSMVDVVSYNLLMKGYLVSEKVDVVEEILAEVLQSTVRANESSFHGLLNARMISGNATAAWKMVDRMRAAGVKPNAVTCAILLKGGSGCSRADHVRRVIELIRSLDAPMDEVLLSSVVEACLGTGQLPLLSKLIGENSRRNDGVALTAPTYGSLIKAFGQIGDVNTVWTLWQEMRAKEVEPTETTLGCMIEALVSNNRHADACQLVQQIWANDVQRHLINTVIYSTLLKGLGRHPTKAMSIYEEMMARGIPCNLITYNTILNSFALNGATDQAAQILHDMANARPPVAPDIVTFSTLIKGFCSSGYLSRALELFEDMKKDGNIKVDEVVYNSLLDGCAKEQRVDDLLKLVAEMQAGGVVPSNYTLSMLVKCLGRCRRLAQAFSLVESITKEHGFRLNIQVYTCLIQACFQNRKLAKAVALLDQLESEGLRADEKVFTVLVRGCLQSGNMDKAVEFVRRAFKGDWPVGVEARTLEEVTTKLGRTSDASRALLAEIDSIRRQHVEQQYPKRRSPNEQWRQGGSVKAADIHQNAFAPIKRLPARQEACSSASTTSGTGSGSGSEFSS